MTATMTDELRTKLHDEGYRFLRVLDNGEMIALRSFMFTTGLVVGLDETGYRTRYCYEDENVATLAVALWDGEGDPPGNWIKQKPEERMNPNYKEDWP